MSRYRRVGALMLFAAGLACSSGLAAPTDLPSLRAPATTAVPASAVPLATRLLPTASAPGDAATTAPGTIGAPAAPPTIAGCQVFPTDNVWNARVDGLPLDGQSITYTTSISLSAHMHADFGAGDYDGGPIGIPFVVVPNNQAKVDMSFHWGDQSDSGPYPIPPDAPIEWGSDHHVLVLQQGACVLYELYAAEANNDGSWFAYAGAKYDLGSDALRPATWTSADAAGLPILPGLVRYDEVAAGAIHHAIRFTAPETQDAFIWPARHQAGDSDPTLPPMGQRFRLKHDYPIDSFPPQAKIILQALKTYGMILADNGSPWYLSGAPDDHWDNDDLHSLGQVPGSAFEAMDESSLMSDPNSGRVGPPIVYNHFLFLPSAAN